MLWLVFLSLPVAAEELRIGDRSWSGLSELLAIGASEGGAQYVPQVDVGRLRADEGLLIVHPVHPLPTGELAKFMHRGGRVAVADDLGEGRRFFGTFGMELHAPKPALANVLRHNANLPIASPLMGHALSDGVQALVTNHPQVLSHPTLTPVFALGGERSAVVLSGAVGSGRLVAISDASVLINNMLQFRGNRMFARNLIRFLRGSDPHGRVLIADSETRWQAPARILQHPLFELSSALDRLSHLQLPKLAVTVLSIALAGLLLGVLGTSLPKRSTFARRAYLQSGECIAGMAGRVSRYSAGDRNLLVPLVELRREIEVRATERLRDTHEVAASDVPKALGNRGITHLAIAFERFITDIDRLQSRGTLISARHFSDLVASGRRILADLDALVPPHHHERHE